MGLFTCLMNKQKYNNNISRKYKRGLKSKQPITKWTIKNRIKTCNNNKASSLLTFIEISLRQKHSSSDGFIRLLIMRYIRQDEASNDGSVRIQPAVCENNTYFRNNSVSLVRRRVVCEKRIIRVRRSLL